MTLDIPRPNQREYFLGMALWTSSRSTCLRDKVGCILVDKEGYVLATGYNGVASGAPHCTQKTCKKKKGKCNAIHAEMNALIQCRSPSTIHTCYCTKSPCRTCAYLLLNTSCQRVIFNEEYREGTIEGWKKVRGKNEWTRS